MDSLVRHLRSTTRRNNRFERMPPVLAYHRRILLTSAWLTAWESQNLKKERDKPEYRHLRTILGSQHSTKFEILRTCARNGGKKRLYRARRNKKLSRNVCGSTSINTHIYYYTPLPLNLANKQQQQQQQQQQAILRAVLAIVPSQRLGSFAHVAILKPRLCPCQIQVLSQKITGGGPGAVAPSREVPSQICAVFGQRTKANGCYTPRAA